MEQLNTICEVEYSSNIISNKKLFGFLFQSFIYGTVVGSMSMLIPLYALSLNSDAVQVGLITGSRGMGHFLLVVPVGILLDRFGIKKVFIISSFFSFLIVLFMPFAKIPQVLLLFALAEGLACSTRLTSLNAWAFELLPYLKPSQTGWYKGVSGTGTTIIGPILASFLAEGLGFTTAFTVVAIITLIVNIIELFFGTSNGAKLDVNRDKESVLSACISLLKMFKNPRLLFVSYAESLNSAFTSCFRILIILLIVVSMQKSSGLVSLITSFVGVAYLIVVFLGGFILNYLKSVTIYILSSSIVVISLFILATNQEINFISLASILAGIGLGSLSLVNYKNIGEIKGDSGKVSGIITFTTGVTLCMAPMTISCIVEMFNFQGGFFTLIIPFLMLIVMIFLKIKIKSLWI